MTKKERILSFLLAAHNFTRILNFMIVAPLDMFLVAYFNISPREFSFLKFNRGYNKKMTPLIHLEDGISSLRLSGRAAFLM